MRSKEREDGWCFDAADMNAVKTDFFFFVSEITSEDNE